jgi:hypothetical protein
MPKGQEQQRLLLLRRVVDRHLVPDRYRAAYLAHTRSARTYSSSYACVNARWMDRQGSGLVGHVYGLGMRIFHQEPDDEMAADARLVRAKVRRSCPSRFALGREIRPRGGRDRVVLVVTVAAVGAVAAAQ